MFKIIEDVGRGGFGSVVMVKRMEDKRQVAIKKVPHLTEKEQWSNLDEIYFLQECKHSLLTSLLTYNLKRLLFLNGYYFLTTYSVTISKQKSLIVN